METGTKIMIVILTMPLWASIPYYLSKVSFRRRKQYKPKPRKELTPKEAFIELSKEQTKPAPTGSKILHSAKGLTEEVAENVFEAEIRK